MKFSINKNRLLGVLLHLKNALPSWKTANGSSAGYVWRSFIFEAKNDNLAIQATDSEILMKEEMSLLEPIEENKTFAVDATQLIKAIKTLDDQPLDFEVLEYQVIVHHETGHFALPLVQGIECYFDGNDVGVDYREAKYLNIEAPGLKSILARCAYAMADDYLRPVMNGVYLDMKKDGTNFVATDGYKLIKISKPTIKDGNDCTGLVIPKKVVSILLKVLPDTDFVQMWFNPYDPNLDKEESEKRPATACKIEVNDMSITFKPIEGRYPNYESVIPTTYNSTLTVDRKSLIKSLDRLSLFANSNSGLITIYLEPDKMQMQSEDKDFEQSAVDTIPCKYDGGKLRFGTKDHSLLQTLRNFNATDVVFKLIDQHMAIIIGPTIQPESEEITALLMPMLIND
ncbi:DNA polymerase III subunit beta [Prevotella brevis]|nr:DNA polymerase III subunit beta [Xylanibacter brevis]